MFARVCAVAPSVICHVAGLAGSLGGRAGAGRPSRLPSAVRAAFPSMDHSADPEAASSQGSVTPVGLSPAAHCLPVATFPGSACLCCGGALRPFWQKAVVAKVLGPSGWSPMRHIPVRCRNHAACERADKAVWHNYTAVGKSNRLWTWPADEELRFFFIVSSWGVTTAWLRQMSQRILHHFASFAGEAAVHEASARRDEDSSRGPPLAKTKLKAAWLLWRLVVRAHEHSAAVTPPLLPPVININLAANLEASLGHALVWYFPHMLGRRLRHLAQAGQNTRVIVVDGNCKLSRRICGRESSELLHHAGLMSQTVVRCGRTPSLKRKFCAAHLAGPTATDVPDIAQSEVVDVLACSPKCKFCFSNWPQN